MNPPNPWDHVWVTKKEAASLLRVHPVTIDRLVKRGEIRRYSLAGVRGYRYDADEISGLYTEDHK